MNTRRGTATSFRELSAKTWQDLEALFGPRGGCGGCWCMYWRLDGPSWHRQKGDANRKALRSLIARNAAHGIIAYVSRTPAGWCAVGPINEFGRLQRSRLQLPSPQGDAGKWCIPCLYIKRDFRRQGLSIELIQRAVKFALDRGATSIEAYPRVPLQRDYPAPALFTGTPSAFRAAGFDVVAEPFKNRKVMRWKKRKRQH